MEKIKNTLGITKPDVMSGIGADQSAMMENEEFARQATNPEASMDRDVDPKSVNTFGGPSLGRESKSSDHKSELLNKLDPRIGYSPEEADASVERYESKYGKPREGVLEEKKATTGTQMMGIGSDQSALVEQPPQDSEGHV